MIFSCKQNTKKMLLIATSHDVNFQIFLISFVVIDTKNDESWTWFFRQFSGVIPNDKGLARTHFGGDIYNNNNTTTSNITGSIKLKSFAICEKVANCSPFRSIQLMMIFWFASRKHDPDLMKASLTRSVEKFLEVIYLKSDYVFQWVTF